MSDDYNTLVEQAREMQFEGDQYEIISDLVTALVQATDERDELRAKLAEVIEAGDGLNHAFPTDDDLQAWQEITKDLR